MTKLKLGGNRNSEIEESSLVIVTHRAEIFKYETQRSERMRSQ